MLDAQVEGGKPPYSYAWSAVLDSGRPATVSRQAKEAVRLPPETRRLRLVVTDANGVAAEREMAIVARVERARLSPRRPKPFKRPAVRPATLRFFAPKVYTGKGWTVTASSSSNSGLTLTNINFNGKTVIDQMSLPFVKVQTNKMGKTVCQLFNAPNVGQPCETWLTGGDAAGVECFNGNGPGCAVDNVEYPGKFYLRSSYALFDVPAADSCALYVTQTFYFQAQTTGCAPGDGAKCMRYWPEVDYYLYNPETGDKCTTNKIVSFEADQRFDHTASPVTFSGGFGSSITSGGDLGSLISDPDTGFVGQVTLSVPPLTLEIGPRVMANHGLKGVSDNYHQKDAATGTIFIPSCNGLTTGNFNCHHLHWRWFGSSGLGFDGSGADFGNGAVLVPASQFVEAFVVVARSTLAEHKPAGWDPGVLVNGESIAPSGGKGKNLGLWVRTTSKPGINRASYYGSAWNGIADAINVDSDWFVR